MKLSDLNLTIPPHCRRCTYDLAAGDADRCPECGAPTPRGLRKTAIRDMTDDERAACRSLAGTVNPVLAAGIGYAALILLTLVLIAGVARSGESIAVKLAVAAFGLFVVVAPLPYVRGRVVHRRRQRAGAGRDAERGVAEILDMPVRRAIRIGQPRASDIKIAGREPPRTPDPTVWYLLLEGDAETWAVLSPHALRALVNDKPTTCPSTLHLERAPHSGIVFDARLESEPIAVSGAPTHITAQQIRSDIEIAHRAHLDRLLNVLGDKPWDAS